MFKPVMYAILERSFGFELSYETNTQGILSLLQFPTSFFYLISVWMSLALFIQKITKFFFPTYIG